MNSPKVTPELQLWRHRYDNEKKCKFSKILVNNSEQKSPAAHMLKKNTELSMVTFFEEVTSQIL